MLDSIGTDAVVGMVHLPPLPGAPRYDGGEGGRERCRERALADARALEAGGVDAVLVENFGDAPFYPDDVPKHVVADMTALVGAVRDATGVPVGVNVLRNDAAAALSVAAATESAFVRVNVHSGARVTDQGVVEGIAHETMRLRERLDADVAVLADVDVKHSASLGVRGDADLENETRDVVERGLADGVVVSGTGTGASVDRDRLERVAAVAAEAGVPTFVGSGATADTAADLLDVADGVVVGSALKRGNVESPVSEERVRAFVEAADR